MTRTFILALAATAALAGCNKEDHTIVAGGPQSGEPANVADNANVTLPPAIASSKVYRCADNDVVYVDWLSDGKSANVRTKEDAPATQVVSAEAGKPMVAAGGYSLSGSATDSSVKIAVPGQKEESCKA